MHSPNHPWRKYAAHVKTVDPTIGARSYAFTAHLKMLSPEDRQKIEAAERLFVLKSSLDTNLQHATARDYVASMMGAMEDDPVTV